MSSNVPDGGWAILDRAGNARIVIPEANIDIDHRMARVVPAQRGRRSVRLLSDLNRWMLKILLLAETPANLWPGPRSPILSPTDLHRVAGVSPEMAHRFVRAFEALDLLRRTPEGLRIARRSALLDLWRAEEVLDRRDGVPVRWMMGRLSNLQDLAGRGKSGEPDLVVAGFEACRMLGLLHAPIPAAREVHALVPVDAILLRYDLERCPPGDADLRLLPCRTVQSVLRGSLDHGGLRIVDAFQAALDVLHHPARGREQSDYLVTQVLHLEDER